MSNVAFVDFGQPRVEPINQEVRVAENKKAGFFTLERLLLEADWATDAIRFSAWVRLIGSASHKQESVKYKGRAWTLERGQLLFNRREFAQKLKDRDGNAISVDAVSRILKFFEREGMVVLESTAWGYVVTILNYDAYQSIAENMNKTIVATATPPATPVATPPATPSDSNKASSSAGLAGCESSAPATPPATAHATATATTTEQPVKPIQQDKDLNTSCPVSDETGPHQENKHAGADAVIDYLNQVTGSKYQKKPHSRKPISGRLSEGNSVEDLQLVVAFKHEHWHSNPDMAQYLRPATLFGTEKFNGYLTAAKRWHEIGRPKCVNGEWEGFERKKPGSQIAQAQAKSKAWQAEHGPAYDDNTQF